MKKFFFPNKRKNYRIFRTDVPIRFQHALRTLEADAAMEKS